MGAMSDHQYHATTDNDAERRLQALLSNSSLGILEVAVDGTISLGNRTLGHWIGIDPPALVGRAIGELMSPEDYATLSRQLSRLASGSIDATTVTHRLRSAGRSDLWVRSAWTVRRSADGSITHLIGIVENIMQQREDELVRSILEESIRGLEDRRRFVDRVIGGLPVIAWRALPNGVCEYLSPQWCVLTGIRDGSGLRWLAAIHPDDRRLLAAAWSAPSPDSDEPRRLSCRIRHADGIYHRYEIVASPVRDEDRLLVAWSGIFVPASTPVIATSRHALASSIAGDLPLRALANRPPETPNGNGYISA
jgi:PAS domain S-box-containing protein